MRIVFFGSPEAAVPSLEKLITAGHDLVLVITQPDKPAGRGKPLTACPVKRYALEHGLSVLQPEKIRKDPAILDALQNLRPDIQVVTAYGQIIPGNIISLPRYRSVNVHFSLLPKYRGASPVAWSLLRGETRTGITIFELNERMDEGDVLSQTGTDILPGENARELERRLAEMGASLLTQALDRIDRLDHRPQDHSLATYAPKLHKDDGRLDWKMTAEEVDRRVRAFTPWPSAFTGFRGRRLILLQGRVQPDSPHLQPPGTILSSSREGLAVVCGRDVYLVEKLQPENKNPMSGHQFSLGARIGEGERLGD